MREDAPLQAPARAAARAEASSFRAKADPVSLRPRRPAKAVRTAEIARLLQVTGAVDGVGASQRFALPSQAFKADMSRSLWKERAIGTPFVTGC
jgi:hypothetical protein